MYKFFLGVMWRTFFILSVAKGVENSGIGRKVGPRRFGFDGFFPLLVIEEVMYYMNCSSTVFESR